MPSLVPITSSSRITVPLNGNGSNTVPGNYYGSQLGGYGYGGGQNPGSGHQGIDDLRRIDMSLRSGLESEVTWALSLLTRFTIQPSIALEGDPFLGHELIRYFTKPYQLLNEKRYDLVDQNTMTYSLDALLTLRNLAQDLSNQQWLSQIPSFKKNLLELLKFLTNWFYHPQGKEVTSILKYDNQFAEALNYLVDLLEPLTCYYIDNSKHDPLFHLLLNTLVVTPDKNLFVGILKCVSHLLIVWDRNAQKNEDGGDFDGRHHDDDLEQEEDDVNSTNNCIDSITDAQLETITNTLLVGDNEINNAVLEFLKMYLFSEALHEKYPSSVKDSQKHRLRKLLQLNSSKASFNTLMKQLPLLLVSNLPLNEPVESKQPPALNLTKRSQYSGVPIAPPELSEELFRIIVTFPEPMRASTWLHCCYEPTTTEQGEVTQISIWKAYENQFQELWKNNGEGVISTNYRTLLSAVDFIKNVTKAFPYAEAKVISLPSTDSDLTPKRKFIIRGIQPRQFPVSIDIGKYDALKPMTDVTVDAGDENLPIGHIDTKKFQQILSTAIDTVLFTDASNKIDKSSLNLINASSHDLLEYIILEVLDSSPLDSKENNIFRLYNSYWLPDLVYANPSLIAKDVIDANWLKYLL
ncbi:Chromatin structure-remodeling complex subunit RSC9 [Candida viswanathii]|uniref:Chromatin structure-remodeling complex subunit RSC9 n=1 Tax=Candida viswanathii TaxID=5486 RepID=A0A367XPM4_9ASCO|nr:Chromatin structure-remodeling complex subunit RSC9 [Candida viswanathii]